MKRLWALLVCLVLLFAAPAVFAGELDESMLDELQLRASEIGVGDYAIDLNVRIPVPGTPVQPPVDLFGTVIRHKGESLPTILVATPYRREIMMMLYLPLLAHGYNLMGIDIRGTGSSKGSWVSFAPEEHFDTAYVIDEWIPGQPWSDGNVGMIGPSYMAIIQLMAAGQIKTDSMGNPVHLKALFPIVSMSDAYRDIVAHGANLDLEFIPAWLGLVEILGALPPLLNLGENTPLLPDLNDLVEASEIWEEHLRNISVPISWFLDTKNEYKLEFYESRSPMIYWPVKPDDGYFFPEYPDMNISTISPNLPVFLTGGWFDIFTRGTLNNYAYGLKNHAPGDKALLVGPWYHIDGSMGMGVMGLVNCEIAARWFDLKIKGIGGQFMTEFPVVLYVDGIRKWRAEKSWPLPECRTENRTYYLSKKKADKIALDWFSISNAANNYQLVEKPGFDDYNNRLLFCTWQKENPVLEHNPMNLHGLLSRSSTRWMMGIPAIVSQFSKLVLGANIDAYMFFEDERADEVGVLTFTTDPLKKDLEIVGPLTLTFWASTKFGGTLPANKSNLIMDRIESVIKVDSNVFTDIMNAKDVQWVVEINDVFPNGRARNISSGWLNSRARPYNPAEPHGIDPAYRADPFNPLYDRCFQQPDFIKEGEVYEYVVEVWPMCNVFKAGHRIRVSLSASDFPHLLPVLRGSNNTIVIDEKHPARIEFKTTKPGGENVTWKWIDKLNTYLTTSAN
ncbi:MAG: CocE/NonD family hydrolase [Desulfomonilia bacterium]|jgi:predicted acyl esterase